MRIKHRVSLAVDSAQQQQLLSHGISVETGFTTFVLDDEEWAPVSVLLDAWNAVDIVETTFSKDELSRSKWLQMVSTWHHGYPQPWDDAFGFLNATYGDAAGCASCGCGRIQSAPFRMSKEPKWGKRSLLQLNWVFDEFFATPQVWERCFHPLGVECMQVLDASGGRVLKTVVQLRITAESMIREPGGSQLCDECGTRKFPPDLPGYFAPPTGQPKEPLFRTKEYFGSGARAFKAVLVSQELYQRLVLEKVRGVDFVPVDPT